MVYTWSPDHIDLSNTITRSVLFDHLSGWSMECISSNPTQSVRVLNFPQTRPAWPVATPNRRSWTSCSNDHFNYSHLAKLSSTLTGLSLHIIFFSILFKMNRKFVAVEEGRCICAFLCSGKYIYEFFLLMLFFLMLFVFCFSKFSSSLCI